MTDLKLLSVYSLYLLIFTSIDINFDNCRAVQLPPVAELQKVARDEKVSFGMATLHFVGKFESQVYYQTLWYSYYYSFI